MAQALRKIWLSPEEQHEPLAPQPRPQRRRRAATSGWMRIALITLLISGGAAVLVTFVSTYARIAEYEMQCQALRQEVAQLNRESVELNLEFERLATQPRLARVAQAEGLELPGPERVSYLQDTPRYPRTYLAQAGPPSARSSWAQRSGQQVVAVLGSAWHLLSGGEGSPAYAQE